MKRPDPEDMDARLDGSEPAGEALPRLVREEGPRLLALAKSFCASPEEAEDLVQEVFLQAYRSWDQFQGRSKVGTWLYTIAARACQRMHRKRSGEPERVESLDELLPLGEPRIGVVPARDDGPLEAQLRAEATERVRAAVAALPTDFRMPLVLKEVVGLDLAEIAAVMDLPAATVKTRLHRARLKVRRALEEALPERAVPPPAYSREVCLDLLAAKQAALDKQAAFAFPEGVVCERCAELFATLDLAGDLCREVARGELPESLQRAVLERLEQGS